MPQESSKPSPGIVFLVFLVLLGAAAVLRFHKLGEWSFGYDELFTIMETESLFGEADIPEAYRQTEAGPMPQEETQYYRLPRMVFMAHAVHWLDYKLFGKDEFGSRVLMAVMGSLSVGVVFLLAQPLFGMSGGVILSLLILVWPDHLFQSQTNRFYMQAFLLISILLLLGGRVAKDRSFATALWLGPVSVAAVLSNSFVGAVWGIMLGGLVVDLLLAKRDEPSKPVGRCVMVITIWSVILLGIAFFHILPLAASWNDNSKWGYTPVHAAMSFVNMLGWPTFVLGGLGTLFLLTDLRRPGNGYWCFCVVATAGCVVILPLKITYNPMYGFLFAFPWLVASALLLWRIYRLLADSGVPCARCAACLWIVAAVSLNVPSLASYYRDGNRHDLRSAFRYVEDRWQPGDRLTGFSMGAGDWYAPECNPKIPLRTWDTATRLQEITDENPGGRLWIVVQSNRGGLDLELLRWLGRHAPIEAKYTKKRFDYMENNVEVYLKK